MNTILILMNNKIKFSYFSSKITTKLTKNEWCMIITPLINCTYTTFTYTITSSYIGFSLKERTLALVFGYGYTVYREKRKIEIKHI